MRKPDMMAKPTHYRDSRLSEAHKALDKLRKLNIITALEEKKFSKKIDKKYGRKCYE